MANLETKYMGLTLKSPIIVGSSGLTNSVEKIKELEANGAGAVVLKSVFEEQILMEAGSLSNEHQGHAEEADYLNQYVQRHELDEYLKLIKEAKKAVSIPVIASVNCVSAAQWTSFAEKIQDAGADGLELNMFILPTDYRQKGEEVEKIYFDILHEVNQRISIPIAIKLSHYFSGLAHTIFELSVRKVAGIVLFNRFYRTDVNLKKVELVSSHIFSTPDELVLPLRWVGIMSDKVKCDLAASTGVHDGNAVVKCLLVGAKAVQVATILYKKGPAHIKTMLDQVQDWMKEHNYSSIADFTGKLNRKECKDPLMYDRVQFMKYVADSKV